MTIFSGSNRQWKHFCSEGYAVGPICSILSWFMNSHLFNPRCNCWWNRQVFPLNNKDKLLILLKFHELPFFLCVKHRFLSNWTRNFFYCVRNTPRKFFVQSRTQEGTVFSIDRTSSHWAKRGTMNSTKSSTILLVVVDWGNIHLKKRNKVHFLDSSFHQDILNHLCLKKNGYFAKIKLNSYW